jgi:hypothetical protein
MTYIFTSADKTVALHEEDGGNVPWNPTLNQPEDIGGYAGRLWMDEGSPIPAPYVAPPPTPEQFRVTQFDSDAERRDFIMQIMNATPEQIKTYITNNVTDLPSARAMLIKLALLVAKVIRD